MHGGLEPQAASVVVKFWRGDLQEADGVRVDPGVEQSHARRGRAYYERISGDGGGCGTCCGGGGHGRGYGVDCWRHFLFSLVSLASGSVRRTEVTPHTPQAVLLVLLRGSSSGGESVLLVEILLAHLRAARQIGHGGHRVQNWLREFRPARGGVLGAGGITSHAERDGVRFLLRLGVVGD